MPPASSRLVPPALPGGRYYCPDFANEETEVQKVEEPAQGHTGGKCAVGTSLTPEPSLWTIQHSHFLLLPHRVPSSGSGKAACGMDRGVLASWCHPMPKKAPLSLGLCLTHTPILPATHDKVSYVVGAQ